jgi:hypothetical protein
LIFFNYICIYYQLNYLTDSDKQILNNLLSKYIELIRNYGEFISNDGILNCGNESIDMKNEIVR